jgi:hypothetical protein
MPMCSVRSSTLGKEATVMYSIGKECVSVKNISAALQEAPLCALRRMLPDRDILDACAEAGHSFRNRFYGPVVTVFHFLLQALQREESFAATWEELCTPVVAEFGISACSFSSSVLSQARSRFPKAAMESLASRACHTRQNRHQLWRGFRLLGLDCTTVSMPRERALFKHFGAHRARTTTVRYPLATFAALLNIGTSLVEGYCFGPFDPGEVKTATPLLESIGKGDLLLADRHFSGSPSLARILSRGADFLMRKNAKLNPQRLPVIRKLGRDDFITEMPMSKPARKLDPSLPEKVRVRLFRARWTSPAGERLQEWFVTSLHDRRRFCPCVLANLYHLRWRLETSYCEFKTFFHGDILRSKTVDNVIKEFAAHVLAYQLIRRLILEAALRHGKKPTGVSVLHAARWVMGFCARMSVSPAWKLPLLYEKLLEAIASTQIDVRPGRLEPRALTREWKHYPHLRQSRSSWRKQRLASYA